LFAIPKVKIVETIDKEEVDRLVSLLDDSACLTQAIAFAGVELQYNHKQKYRLQGLEVTTGQSGQNKLTGAMSPSCMGKADVQRALSSCSVVKGKYEHELRFCFIPTGVSLVPEDEIFSGNNLIYADMRCKLRKDIQTSAQRFVVEGPGTISREQS